MVKEGDRKHVLHIVSMNKRSLYINLSEKFTPINLCG